MPIPLDYARPERRVRSLALPAFIVGLCSGPAAIGLAVLTPGLLPGGPLAVFLVVLAGSFLFACIAAAKLPADSPRRQRRLAAVAIFAPIAWFLLLAFLAECVKRV